MDATNMHLKNYTSSVPVEKTIARIEFALARAGANGILKDYDNGRLSSLSFRVMLPTGKPISIRLPANADAVWMTMKRSVKRPRSGTMEALKAQADRTAWKLMQDWVEVQLSLISMQQVEFMQVFLPYVWDGEQTFYDKLKGGNFAALPQVT
jgi:hypothetical protein